MWKNVVVDFSMFHFTNGAPYASLNQHRYPVVQIWSLKKKTNMKLTKTLVLKLHIVKT